MPMSSAPVSSAAGPDAVPVGASGDAADGAVLWDEIRQINQLLGQTTDRAARVKLARRRAGVWEQLTLLTIEVGAAPWYAAACACITEVAAEAAERIAGRRPPRPLL
jgi:hypothetical protein